MTLATRSSRFVAICATALAFVAALGARPGAVFARSPFSHPAFTTVRGDIAPADRGVAADVARAANVRDFGPMRPNALVKLGLLMRVRNQAQLEQLIVAQGTKSSPFYHRYLSPAQFAASFAPTAQSYAQTIALLQRRGFRVTQTLRNRAMIGATAPASVVERYFQTELHSVYQLKHGVRYVNVRPAVMPAELRNSVISISGLHSIVTVGFPKRQVDAAAVRRSPQYQQALARVMARQKNGTRTVAAARSLRQRETPIGMSTPPANPSPDPTESPENADSDYLSYYGYGPPIYATGYDYPVEHGYGGHGIAAGSVIDMDYLDSDETLETKTFAVPRTGTTSALGYRRCIDPAGGPTCDGVIGAGDSEGESTLDAVTILSLAPAADFYEYLSPDSFYGGLNDIGIEFAYEAAVNDDIVSVLNSSFGACETSDPSFEYATNYIAMEGASLGITFSASSGDNGALTCGPYASNGVSSDELDVFAPSADRYFTSVGGTSYLILTPNSTNDYNKEQAWEYGGGGFSVYQPIPSWQTTLVGQSSAAANVSKTNRNIPDVAFCADPGTNPDGFVGGVDGVSFVIAHNGSLTASGGTSLASPMYVAMQTEIDQVEHSRNGLVTPSLYAIAATSSAEYAFGFHDVTLGMNNYYNAVTGYDDATGIGSMLGWELAGAAEYGTPGGPTPGPLPTGPPLPSPSPTVMGATPMPTPTQSPTPSPTPTAHANGTSFKVVTIAGNGAAMSMDSTTGTTASFDNPVGIAYVPSSATGVNTQSTTDNYLVISDFATGFIRTIDLTAAGNPVVTDDATSFSTTTNPGSGIYGLGYLPTGSASAANGGLFALESGGTTPGWYSYTLPLTTKSTATQGNVKALTGGPAAIAFNTTTDNESFITSVHDDTLSSIQFAGSTLTFGGTFAYSTALPARGNFGITYFPPGTVNTGQPLYYITDSGLNEILTASDTTMSTITKIASGAPLNSPRQITYVSGTGNFYVANCLGNDIVRVTPSGTMTVVAGFGAAGEQDGFNTGASFDCPFGITTDGTNLFVTDSGGNAVREITSVQ